jgi:uncharacterized protein
MPEGLSPKLPLSLDPSDGYGLNKTYKEMVKQNMKMIVLTAPGERIMDPLFGVGLRNYLFEQNHPMVYGEIESKIRTQVKKYLGFVEILDIDFNSKDSNPAVVQNVLYINLTYRIKPLDSVDGLELYVSGN